MFFPHFSQKFHAALPDNKEQPIVITGHMRPDGDCIGSMVGMGLALQASGYQVNIYNNDPIPRTLENFQGNISYTVADKQMNLSENPFVIACDAADQERMGEQINHVFPEVNICVDHHITNEGYGSCNLIDPHAAATAEIIAGMFFDLEYPIDKDAAQALYIGIATDTGQFRYPSTTRRVFELASRLLECGANPGEASIALYDQELPQKMELLQRFLSRLERKCDQQLCLGYICGSDYEETGATYDDAEGLVDYARSLYGVEIGAILEERGNKLKGSLRAKEARMRVDILAGQFGGGGHACAAGFSVEGAEVKHFYSKFVNAVENHIRDLELD